MTVLVTLFITASVFLLIDMFTTYLDNKNKNKSYEEVMREYE